MLSSNGNCHHVHDLSMYQIDTPIHLFQKVKLYRKTYHSAKQTHVVGQTQRKHFFHIPIDPYFSNKTPKTPLTCFSVMGQQSKSTLITDHYKIFILWNRYHSSIRYELQSNIEEWQFFLRVSELLTFRHRDEQPNDRERSRVSFMRYSTLNFSKSFITIAKLTSLEDVFMKFKINQSLQNQNSHKYCFDKTWLYISNNIKINILQNY